MNAATTLRVARPTDQLEAVTHFYVEDLGLRVLGSFADHDGFDGVVLGAPGGGWHLELTRRDGHAAAGAPGPEHLLVFYLPDAGDWRAAVERLHRAGHRPVQPANPYWDRHGRTYVDPDGYRIVLQNAAWP